MIVKKLNLGAEEEVGDYKDRVEIKRRFSGNEQEITTTSAKIRSEEDLIAYAEIDMTVWKIKNFEVNSWEVTIGKKNTATEKPETYTNFQVKARLEKRTEEPSKMIFDRFIEDTKNYSPKYPTFKRKKDVKDYMLEISIPDIHYGLLAWADETRDKHYDIKIAEQTFLDCVDYIIKATKDFKIKKILFPIGNDFFNVNSALNTTFNGTIQDEDCRWQKSFTFGRRMAIKAIDMLLTVADVEVPIIPGNHDLERIYYLGEVLKAWYKNTDQITIDNSPLHRKYYSWGKCLIGFDHGSKSRGRKMKLEDLPLIMADEVPKLWANAEYKEIHTAHLHSLRATEKRKVRIITLPSLVPLSAWASAEGYNHLKEAQAFLWHKERGNVSTIYYHPIAT
jgi:hypothetical protein